MGIRRYAGAPTNGTSEVQTLTIGGTPTGGTFKLSFEGFVSAAITWSATNATLLANINTALRAMPNLGASEITAADVSLTAGIGALSLTFGGVRGKQAIGELFAVHTNALTGTSPTLVVTETTPGVDATQRGVAGGSILVDTTNKKAYINTGTATAPTWTVVGTQS
jgi:hypothetical protein